MKKLVSIFFTLIITHAVASDFNEFIVKDKSNVQTALALHQAGYLTVSTDHWLKSIEIMQREAATKPKDAEMHKLLAESYLGLLQSCMAKEDEKTFKKHEDDAMEVFKQLEDYPEYEAEALAWQGALYGWRIAFSPIKGMFLGPKSQSILEDALEANQQSAEAWVRMAASLLFTPEMFGGDPEKAVQHFEKGIALYEKQGNNDWKYLDALAWLGQAYVKTNQPEKAKAVFEKALQVEPKFYWVKNSLLPKLNKAE